MKRKSTRELLLARKAKEQEKVCLYKIQLLPDELIREIYSYLCGNAKNIMDNEMTRRKKEWLQQIVKTDILRCSFLSKYPKRHIFRWVYTISKRYPEMFVIVDWFIRNSKGKTGLELLELWALDYMILDDYDVISAIQWCIQRSVARKPYEIKHLSANEVDSYMFLLKSITYMSKREKAK